MADLEFSVHGKTVDATRIDVRARSFTIIVDEPASLGGADAGPNPVEYELAALVGCMNVMGHIIAREMSIELRGMEIEARGTLNPDKLMGRKTADRAGYKEIVVTVDVDSPAPRARLESWLQKIEERCPVSDNLSRMTPVRLSVRG
jgi:uncharacterized OsmC-like protein